MLFHDGKCWLCNTDDKPYSVNYQAVKDGDNSYKVMLSVNNLSMVLSLKFRSNPNSIVGYKGLNFEIISKQINECFPTNGFNKLRINYKMAVFAYYAYYNLLSLRIMAKFWVAYIR